MYKGMCALKFKGMECAYENVTGTGLSATSNLASHHHHYYYYYHPPSNRSSSSSSLLSPTHTALFLLSLFLFPFYI
ncbi:hypothetical protein K492DRAFT_75377 [Lichtheimia hyalospora FSU 10163]|nr:hypothetical protein K492DRAFT_75377 [Lichtheimia hyalospora FSU 10163]